jgi:hypothetical protein
MTTITPREKRQLIQLLGLLQDHLESAIESTLVPGTNEPDPADEVTVSDVWRDRQVWKQAEGMISKLSQRTAPNPRTPGAGAAANKKESGGTA